LDKFDLVEFEKSQIVKRCSLFLNHGQVNIEQGLTNFDFRSCRESTIPPFEAENHEFGKI